MLTNPIYFSDEIEKLPNDNSNKSLDNSNKSLDNKSSMEKVIELQGISKVFLGTKALDQVNFNVYRSKIMGLLGENGAGKSTLMKILSGVYPPDSGTLRLGERKLQLTGVRDAQKHGIAIIHQELSLFPDLSIAENLFLESLPTTQLGRIQWSQIYRQATSLLELVKVDRKPTELLKNLSISEQQLVEIARNLRKEAKVLIMDEPSDALTDREVENLFTLIHKLKASGTSIVYITHRLEEVFQICDDVTILRDGCLIQETPCSQLNRDSLISAMVGRSLTESFPSSPKLPTSQEPPILELRGVSNPQVQDINLCVYPREILGIHGLMGAGRTELGKTIFGYYPLSKGQILLKGKELRLQSPEDGVKHKIQYVSEDRKTDGLVLKLSLHKNMVLSALGKFINRFGRLLKQKENAEVQDYMTRFRIKASSPEQIIAKLSGGNQQKVAIAKALMAEPEILILDEPTRGIDVGAKKEIYELINHLKESGLAIILISSEMHEIIGLSDRIAVMCNKRITKILDIDQADQEQLLKFATNF